MLHFLQHKVVIECIDQKCFQVENISIDTGADKNSSEIYHTEKGHDMTRTLLIAALSLTTLMAQQSMASTTEGQFMKANNGSALNTSSNALSPSAVATADGLTGTYYAAQGAPQRFNFHVENGGQVQLASRHSAGAHNASYRLNAMVLDQQGQVVASSASDAQGNFNIDSTLSAGHYTLVVDGNTTQSPSSSDSSYEILTSM